MSSQQMHGRRRFLRDAALTTVGIAGASRQPSAAALAWLAQEPVARRSVPSASLSRQFARWVVGLRFEDLPAAVVDRAKGLTLQNLASALIGSGMPAGQQAVRFVAEEEAGVPGGATVLVAGTKVTKGGAAFANAEMMLAGGKWDTFRRHVISALKGDYRCIAVDLAGFGLSDAPEGFGFRPDEHAALIAGLIDRLDLQDATLVAHDWGGPIGLAAMLQTNARITRLCLGNTWAWPANREFHFQWFSKLMGGPIGRFGTRYFALFINGMIPTSMKRRKLSKDEMTAYRAPFPKGRSRKPMEVFPEQIIGASKWLRTLEAGVKPFDGPIKIIWPEGDIAYRIKELDRWVAMFPHASVTRLPDCGHYLWEDAPEDCIAALRDWLGVGAAAAT